MLDLETRERAASPERERIVEALIEIAAERGYAETTIELYATTGSAALKRVEFTLASAGVEHVETIGRSRVTVGSSGRAVWDFTSS